MPVTAPPSQAPKTQIRVPLGTRRLLERIAEARGWKLNKAVEKAVTDYAKREGIKLPEPSAA